MQKCEGQLCDFSMDLKEHEMRIELAWERVRQRVRGNY
jgi:hypothetical protein